MTYFLLLPTQLFETKHLDKKYKYVLWEHPHYFKKYKYNQKKIVLHKASMEYYHRYLKKKGYSVTYVPYTKKPKLKNYVMFDPVDRIKLPSKPKEVLDTPNFLLKKKHIEAYRKKTKKFFFNAFYMWSKKQLDIIPGVKSKDKQNRKPLSKKVRIPPVPKNTADKKYINEGISFTKSKFKKNYGNTDNFMFPTTHKTAKAWLRHFIKYKFKNFGKYQDAIDKNNSFMFHSILSTSINIGLLNPSDVIDEIMRYRRRIPINSFEGFIRQLFWREYQRYCYKYCKFTGKNYFGNRKKLGKAWYYGTTGINPVDTCIKNAFDTGYLHHIERLMVIGNFMNLSQIHPKEGFKWFMEFSCDSYDWVMHQNVYDMVFFVTGGQTMRRPYVSSSNYILKMSNYEKGEWSDKWNDLYKKFVKRNKRKLYKFRYYFPGI